MALTPKFNDNYKARKENDNVLSIYYGVQGNSVYLAYDFAARMLIMRTGDSTGGLNGTPFSQLDRETIAAMRDKLVELGGSPPELPAEAPAASSPAKKLNL